MTDSAARSQRAQAADAMYDLFAHAPDVSAAGPPAHVQIEQWLMGLIDGGVLLPDDKLPKEKDLAALLGVSRMTLYRRYSDVRSVVIALLNTEFTAILQQARSAAGTGTAREQLVTAAVHAVRLLHSSPLLQRVLPHAALDDLFYSYHFLTGALTLTLSDTARLDRLSEGRCSSSKMDELAPRMVEYAAAGFRAVCKPKA